MKQLPYNIIQINRFSADGKGALQFFEANRDIPFDIKRIYYITGVPNGVNRGMHAHKKLRQLLFCPYGKIQIIIDDGKNKYSHILERPEEGLLLTPCVWREMVWLQKDSVLCVAASDYYDEADYIRNYTEFIQYLENEHER